MFLGFTRYIVPKMFSKTSKVFLEAKRDFYLKIELLSMHLGQKLMLVHKKNQKKNFLDFFFHRGNFFSAFFFIVQASIFVQNACLVAHFFDKGILLLPRTLRRSITTYWIPYNEQNRGTCKIS